MYRRKEKFLQIWGKLTATKSQYLEEKRQEYVLKAVLLSFSIGVFFASVIFFIGYNAHVTSVVSLVTSLSLFITFVIAYIITYISFWKFTIFVPTGVIFLMGTYVTLVYGLGFPSLILFTLTLILGTVLMTDRLQYILLVLMLFISTYAAMVIDENEFNILPLESRVTWFIALCFYYPAVQLLLNFSALHIQAALKEAEKMAHNLTYEVSERSKSERQLRESYAVTEKLMKSKEELFRNMSHEIRTPMGAVVGLTELLSKSTSEQIRYLNTLQLSANNLLVLLNDFLDFSKADAGEIKFDSVVFNIVEVVRQVSDTFSIESQKKNLQLTTEIDEEIPNYVMGDPMRLKQILSNLLSNAIKFTKAGTISIHVFAKDKAGETVQIAFEIKDTGIGIPEDMIDTIFESYQQVDSSITREYGGTGLGLAITQKLVQTQGGTIEVTSVEGEGSTFTVILPFIVSSVPQDIENHGYSYSYTNNKNLEGVHILLVEDNAVNQLVATQMLKGLGAAVDIAYNGDEAITKIEDKKFDVVLMDIQMPQVDGFSATKYLRKHMKQYINNIPIIGLSAHALEQEKRKAIAIGMDEYITKPFTSEELSTKIQNVIQKRMGYAS